MKLKLSLSIFFLGLISGISSASAASEPTICTMEYAPVCGSVQVQCITSPCNPVRQTFGNSCMARASNATNVTPGECVSAPVLESPKMSPREALKNGTWVLDTFNGKTVKGSATLTFHKNTFNAKVCNNLSGQYGVTSNVLIFRKVISTMMYCEGDIMLVEQALNFTRSKFMVGANQLTIKTKKGDVIVWKKQ